MSKHKLFIQVFVGLSVVRLLMSLFFKNCFLLQHIWLLYLSYFVVIGIVLFANFPTVPLDQDSNKVECIMLGNGKMTQEVFYKSNYGEYNLLYESEQGKAYSSNNGEIIYTKPVHMEMKDGNTALALFVYTILYTLIGLYTYELILGIATGKINMEIPLGNLKHNMETFNLMSGKYNICENVKYIGDCISRIGRNAMEMLQSTYQAIVG